MTNFTGHRHSERYTYKRVARSNWQEHEEYRFITGGEVEISDGLDLKVSGKFNFLGYELPNVNDLMRVYYSFIDSKGETFETPIATLFVSYAGLTYTDTMKGRRASGSLTGASTLKAARDRKIGMPMTISKNANPIYEAEQLLRSCGLQVNAEPSSYTMGKSYTFEAGTDYLEIVNLLADFAGYTRPYPDAMGVIQLVSYSTAQERTEYYVFKNDDKSIMYPEIEEQNNWQETPNVMLLLYNATDYCIVAEARNIRGSRLSIEERGEAKDSFERISDLGNTADKRQAMADLAEAKLRAISSDVEYVTLSHAYVPLYIYDPVKIIYSDIEWTGNIEVMKIDLSTATKTSTRIKRIKTQEIEITSEAEVVRGVD